MMVSIPSGKGSTVGFPLTACLSVKRNSVQIWLQTITQCCNSTNYNTRAKRPIRRLDLASQVFTWLQAAPGQQIKARGFCAGKTFKGLHSFDCYSIPAVLSSIHTIKHKAAVLSDLSLPLTSLYVE